MQMCKCQQANIIYAYQSFTGEKEFHFVPGFEYKTFNYKGFWFVQSCFPEKIFGKWKYKGDHCAKDLEFQRKLGPRRSRKKGPAALFFCSPSLSNKVTLSN